MHPDAPKNVTNVLNSGMITQASKVDEFERMLQQHFNHKWILTLNSATAGLTLAFKMLDLPFGAEVLSCPLTCTATNWSILANNLHLKWVDVDYETGNISLDDLQQKITEKTQALVIVHWAGIPVDLIRLNAILDKAEEKFGHRIRVVEDCAHAFDASLKVKKCRQQTVADNGGSLRTIEETVLVDQKIGCWGNIAVFSLQAIKHLTAGDGGLIFLPNEALYQRAKLLRWFGIDRNARTNGVDFRMEPDVAEFGYKYHMNDINASIGISNFHMALCNVASHRKNADYFYEELKDHSSCLLKLPNGALPSWWIFTIKVPKRDEFIFFAKTKGITASQVHRRNDVHSCVKAYQAHLPNLDKYEQEYVSLPCGWWVDRNNQITRCVKQWLKICDAYVRPLTIEDYGQDYLELYKHLNNIDITGMNKDTFLSKLEQGLNQYFVLIKNEKIIGCGKVFIETKMYDPIAHIQDVIIHPTYQRQGYGSRIIYALIQEAKRAKCYKVVLAAQEKNKDFYTSQGFKSDNVEWKIYL